MDSSNKMGCVVLPWLQMIILGASLLTLNPLFITLSIAFVSLPLAHVSNAISYLQFQSHSYNHSAAVIIVVEYSQHPAPL